MSKALQTGMIACALSQWVVNRLGKTVFAYQERKRMFTLAARRSVSSRISVYDVQRRCDCTHGPRRQTTV